MSRTLTEPEKTRRSLLRRETARLRALAKKARKLRDLGYSDIGVMARLGLQSTEDVRELLKDDL